MSDFIKIKPLEWETGWHFGLDLWVAEGYEISFSKEQGWYLKGHSFRDETLLAKPFSDAHLDHLKNVAQKHHERRTLSTIDAQATRKAVETCVEVKPLDLPERRNRYWGADKGYQVAHTNGDLYRVRFYGKVICKDIHGFDQVVAWANAHHRKQILSTITTRTVAEVQAEARKEVSELLRNVGVAEAVQAHQIASDTHENGPIDPLEAYVPCGEIEKFLRALAEGEEQ